MSFSTSRFLRGIEDALWLPAWASAVEERGGRLPHNITRSTARRAPPEVRRLAIRFAGRLQKANNVPLHELWLRASKADGRPADPEVLGYYLTMQGLGHGVSWSDDHAEFRVKVPRIEANAYKVGPKGRRRWHAEGSGFGRIRPLRDHRRAKRARRTRSR